MANVKIQGNASGTGSLVIAAPNTNSTRTVTFPDSDLDLGSIGGAGNVESWVNFNGTGSVSIRDDGNVSSITDNGTGSYTVNFSTSLSHSNFAIAGNAGNLGAQQARILMPRTLSTGSCGVEVNNTGGSQADVSAVLVSVIL